MVQVLVMSDSHGNETALRQALAAQPQVAAVIHLGDGAAEAQRVAAEDSRPWHIVRGNCDYGEAVPVKSVVSVGGAKLYLTHGFAERVKSGLLTLTYTAKEQEVVAALYGHTHIPSADFHEGIWLINPGSISGTNTYAVLEIENGGLYPRMMRL